MKLLPRKIYPVRATSTVVVSSECVFFVVVVVVVVFVNSNSVLCACILYTGKTCVVHGPVYTLKPFPLIHIGRDIHGFPYGVCTDPYVIVLAYCIMVCPVNMAVD